MANRREHLQGLLMQALDTPEGIITKLSGGAEGRRQNAIAALTNLKRELAADIPALLDVQIRPVQGTDDEIAIIHLSPPPEED